MKNYLFLFLFLSLTNCATFKPDSSVIYLAGDSTMSIKAENKRPETGWGEVLPPFFIETIHIDNHAKNGRSTKSFIKENRWKVIHDQLNKGDYVFIQFGHNDGSKSKGERYAPPEMYKSNLVKFIKEARAKKAKPILMTPVVR